MRHFRTLALASLATLALAACGGDDDTTAATDDGDARTVEVDMVDIAFEPETLEVSRGETVRFVFTNRGEVAHDAFIGDADAQADHEADMRETDGDDHGGHGEGDDDAVTVDPGDSEELDYTFDEAGTLEVGCHQPGHYDAGMKITVEVS